jgi:dTDP-3-amino-3,4,6-trideoxy-alpha-D-glucose transaminase
VSASVPFLDLRRQVARLRTELDAALARALDEARFVGGSAVESFERAFSAYCGAAFCVGVASGTDALTIALLALGIERGDEVLTAANTCVPTVAAIEAAGATPVLVDPDPETFTLDPGLLEPALTERTRAIVPVHLYGRCADMEPIVAFARAHRLRVVEDAAQAHGAEYQGRRAGTLADAAAFSFYPTKNLGALGDAGAVVTDDADTAERARLLRNYGERVRYDSVLAGTNSRLDTLQAAVLLAKLPHLDGWNERRRALAARYRQALADVDVRLPGDDEGHVHHLFVLRVANRDELRGSLQERGVQTLVHYPKAIHQHRAYERLARASSLPVSERLAAEVVSLPLYPELSEAEADEVTSAVRDAAARSMHARART